MLRLPRPTACRQDGQWKRGFCWWTAAQPPKIQQKTCWKPHGPKIHPENSQVVGVTSSVGVCEGSGHINSLKKFFLPVTSPTAREGKFFSRMALLLTAPLPESEEGQGGAPGLASPVTNPQVGVRWRSKAWKMKPKSLWTLGLLLSLPFQQTSSWLTAENYRCSRLTPRHHLCSDVTVASLCFQNKVSFLRNIIFVCDFCPSKTFILIKW